MGGEGVRATDFKDGRGWAGRGFVVGWGRRSGGVALLNHRLQAGTPAGCDFIGVVSGGVARGIFAERPAHRIHSLGGWTFANIRRAEIVRLDWSAVKLASQLHSTHIPRFA